MRDSDDYLVQNPVERQMPELGPVRFAIQRFPTSIILILVVMALGMLASTRLLPPASPIVSASTSTESFPVEIQQSLRDRLPPGEIRLSLSRTTFQPGVLLAAQAINGPLAIWVSTGELTIKPVGPGVAMRSYPEPYTSAVTTCSKTIRSGMRRRWQPSGWDGATRGCAGSSAANCSQTGSSRHTGRTGTGPSDAEDIQ
jgi:hypothetical protein